MFERQLAWGKLCSSFFRRPEVAVEANNRVVVSCDNQVQSMINDLVCMSFADDLVSSAAGPAAVARETRRRGTDVPIHA